MILMEKTEVWGWEHAIRGMRNPMNSWERSDSYPAVDCGKCGRIDRESYCNPREHDCTPYNTYEIGANDRKLILQLIRAGATHRKFLRQIFVSVDITAPLYWWKEFDTYKVGTTANSCSTMHKLLHKPFEMSDFSFDKLSECKIGARSTHVFEQAAKALVDVLNSLRNLYFNCEDIAVQKRIWYVIIQLLPESYNQKRTVTMTYENLLSMLDTRRNHKLDEWRKFCDWILELPNGDLLKEGLNHEQG